MHFIDDGSTNPVYIQLPSNTSFGTATFASGEFITIQLHSSTQGIATIHVMSVHRASDCHAQAQAVISS